MTRRLRRERWGCRPERGSTFFRCERKYQRKPAARRLQRRPTSLCAVGFGLREPFGLSSTSARCAHPPGKSPLLPILTAGLAMSRAMKLASLPIRAERAPVLTFFRRQNGRAFFPPLPIAALLRRSRRGADSKESQLGCYGMTWQVLQHRKTGLIFSFAVGTIHTPKAPLGMLRRGLNIPVTQKASAISNPRWPF